MTTYTTTVNDDHGATPAPSSPEARETPPTTSQTQTATDTALNGAGTGDPDTGGSGTNNTGAIVGGTVGGVAGLVLIILAAWYALRQYKAKNAEMRELGIGYVPPQHG
ncbi:hypothetical protein ASPSYDRAFT_1053198 [Aspergillus sydowii CBS 593.65]|uniref:Mid2 domain-containing protein n=1 Tax=Aspergillus sydowii CBS 593.65 TaxID=1036612 RepID=A0A1L9TDB9_9EURO|nr:uncharacterized protein ASPSYDRAFT_1053198 [Aspergillus sydowii CBS 593.65]OJJ57428.1 hypothetical protein ASPSYDRAFT_1053198 [Aspergillus sydowii CBS 593.65]